MGTDINNTSIEDLSLDWDIVFDTEDTCQKESTDSVSDALVMCLTTYGKVDIEYISNVTGKNKLDVIRALKGSVYQNPLTWHEDYYEGWETADEYLSGNLMLKLKDAKAADKKYPNLFTDNINALEKVMPAPIASNEIFVTIGSPWVPTDVIDDFMDFLFGDIHALLRYYPQNSPIFDYLKTRHDEVTGTWEIPYKNRYGYHIPVGETWGTPRMGGLQILENTLNMKTIKIMDSAESDSSKSKTKRVLNKEATMAAVEKQQKMIKAFQDWIWTDIDRKARLERIFQGKYGCVQRRIFDGSFLEFPNMSKEITLYPYQKNAVARILFTPNTLLAHDVGAGKTYVLIAAGQELRRMGLSKKNMYVVPNNIIGQWKSIFLTMYPDAKLLCVDPKAFKPERRDSVLKQMRDGDYDGIIIAYSCFEQIPLSKESYKESLLEKRNLVREASLNRKNDTSGLRRKARKLSQELSKLVVSEDNYDSVYFDELGITRLFIDEAHNFKNVPIETSTSAVLGVSSSGSKKCKDMFNKVHFIQRSNGGKGVVMATGTPITNSITDAFIMQSYLQSGELAMMDLQSFDSWIGMFAERKTEFEVDVDTNSYRLATRFSKFHNLTELTALLSMIADFHPMSKQMGIPVHDGYIDTMVEKTPEFIEYLEEISSRADSVRSGHVSRKEDNMLKITTDGRKAALDMRLVDPDAISSSSSKAAACAKNVADIYFETAAAKSTQLIFCDISTPKAGFNIYDDLKQRLIALGVREEEIAFIHSAETEAKRSKLFKQVRSGEIRILIGSTFKLGLGVNVQDRLIALHHIDVPWRPADMTQREGRIIRQGNMNPKVKICRYITQGSFDAYSWQLLETKQRFISDLLAGSLADRDSSDIEDTVLNYAEVKALAVGNPLVKERVETQNELSRCLALSRNAVESRIRMEKELLDLPGKIADTRNDIQLCEQDLNHYKEWVSGNPSATSTPDKEQESAERKSFRERFNKAVSEYTFMTKEELFGTYKGFDIILPESMSPSGRYVWLSYKGRYRVTLADSEIGNMIRLDNFIEALPKKLDNLKKTQLQYEDRQRTIKEELANQESYTDWIQLLRERITEIDNILGVNKE